MLSDYSVSEDFYIKSMPRIKKRNIPSSLASTFNLVPDATGEFIDTTKLAERKGFESTPFICFFDLGLARVTLENKVFAALKEKSMEDFIFHIQTLSS
jgi:hypothetical protein